ncbi:MAG: rhomboid family intramembrane serine protease [Alphaproteobacteria bacterium]|nr:rhomboid family intramembrane serine protease [Alphaproteobacteria bacterium]MDP6237930.1 rhomboid family intramembrane serine protease [Alphaproteobacteria bacterium]MDP7172236.1 rhomboid family intramembrane serine protease [Alphaproteobacteria bacterium]MDP7235065.1 rhomboid family intramembrane serine protease [Alphaproteobacteria bacterium]MDP7486454.1 rhomboid family intramembrane serine protease [Alphaproteobacteria bacterium]
MPGSEIPTIGASGAISGVLDAYLVLYPRARVLVLIFLGFFVQTVRLLAVIVLGFWIVLQLFSAVTQSTEASGVAVFAHIGGFVAGMALINLFKRGV